MPVAHATCFEAFGVQTKSNGTRKARIKDEGMGANRHHPFGGFGDRRGVSGPDEVTASLPQSSRRD
jgi:hypothetical protein